jgi:biopolymer transport protein ExbB
MNILFLQATTVQVARTESVIDIVMKAGWILIPILLMSILAVYFIIERYTSISSVSKIDNKFISEVCKLIGNKDYKGAKELCKKYNHPAGRIIAAGIDNPKLDTKEIEQIMADESKSEAFKLEKGMSYIGIVATVAPMFGFLGTIFGVIKIFYNISLSDNISIGIIAGGLYQKMVSSAAGLTVGIIAYTGYYYLNGRIDDFIHTLEGSLTQVVKAIRDEKI